MSRVEVERGRKEMESGIDRVEGEVWSGYGGRLLYLKGYRDGSDETRVELLKKAIEFEQDSFLKCD